MKCTQRGCTFDEVKKVATEEKRGEKWYRATVDYCPVCNNPQGEPTVEEVKVVKENEAVNVSDAISAHVAETAPVKEVTETEAPASKKRAKKDKDTSET